MLAICPHAPYSQQSSKYCLLSALLQYKILPNLRDEAEVVMSGQGEHCLQYISVMQCPVGRLTLPEGALQTLGVSDLCVGHQKGGIGVGRGFKARAPHHIQYRPGTVYVTGKEERGFRIVGSG